MKTGKMIKTKEKKIQENERKYKQMKSMIKWEKDRSSQALSSYVLNQEKFELFIFFFAFNFYLPFPFDIFINICV